MRIGLVSLHTSPLDTPGRGDAGGMNVVVRALAEELAREGHDVEVLTRAASAADLGRVETLDSGARVRFLAAGEPGPLVKEELPRITGEFGRMLRELPRRFDVLHSHYWLSGRAALPVARATGSAHVLSLHTVAALKNARLAPGDAPEPPLRLDAERVLTTRSDAVIASTRSERDAIAAAYGASPQRIAIIEPGVDTRLFHPATAGLAAAAPTAVRSPADGPEAVGIPLADTARPASDARSHTVPPLLCVGRIQPLKGQDLAIRALSLLPPGIRPRLLIAGEPSGAGSSGYRAELDRLVAERTAPGEVDFIGALPRPELAALLRRCALLLVPSRSETYGLVTLEAAASGVPVVASRAPGLVDSVRDGVTGVLVDGHDPRGWAAAIEGMLRDPARHAAMARASLAHAQAHGWAGVAARTAELYRRVIASDGSD